MFFVTVIGCDSNNGVSPEPIETEEFDEEESTVEVFSSGGFIAQKDDWLFYSNYNDGGKLYKFNMNNHEHIKVNNDQSSDISIVGDWIYYLSGNNIYRIKSDGSERTLLQERGHEFLIANGWIYYISNYDIHKFRTDGTGHQKITDSASDGPAAHSILIADGWLYYMEGYQHADGWHTTSINKVSLDGDEILEVVNLKGFPRDFYIVNDWIYYIDVDWGNDTTIYKAKTDGSQYTEVKEINAFELVVVGGWIYFTNREDNLSIYKIRYDGSELVKLNDDNSWDINVIGDWVYYRVVKRDDNFNIISEELYQVRTDGSEHAKFNMAQPEYKDAAPEKYYVAVDEGNNLFIRRSYGTEGKSSGDIIGRLPRGTKISIVDKHENRIVADKYTWWEVTDEQTDITGWVAAEYLRRELYEHSEVIKETEWETADQENMEQRGNTVGNIVNGGLVAEHNGWIYYRITIMTGWATTDGATYKVRSDGSKHDPLNTHSYISDINVVDDWIYYSNIYDFSSTYKVRTDGNDPVKINNDDALGLNVVGDWIYYLNYSDDDGSHRRDNRIYKIRTDGRERTKLTDTHSLYLNVVDDWIYFSNLDDEYNIYKIRTDGSEKTKVNNDYSKYINVIGDWIYYCNGSDGFAIYKIRTDGSERTKLSDDIPGTLNVYEGWIYYTNREDNDTIYKLRTDGKGRMQINNERTRNIYVVEDWLYYEITGENIGLYKIRFDGSERQQIIK